MTERSKVFSKPLIDKLIAALKAEFGRDVSAIEAQNICLRLAQFTYAKLLQERKSDERDRGIPAK